MEYLKAKWKWIVTALAVLLGAVLTYLAGRGDQRTSQGLNVLRKASLDALEAEKNAKKLQERSDSLANEFLAEQVRLEAEKVQMERKSDADVDADLLARGLAKPKL